MRINIGARGNFLNFPGLRRASSGNSQTDSSLTSGVCEVARSLSPKELCRELRVYRCQGKLSELSWFVTRSSFSGSIAVFDIAWSSASNRCQVKRSRHLLKVACFVGTAQNRPNRLTGGDAPTQQSASIGLRCGGDSRAGPG